MDLQKEQRRHHRGKAGFTTNGIGKLDSLRQKKRRKKSRPFTKINSKWIIKRNVKHKIIRFLEDNTEENPDDFWYGDD